MQGQADLVGEEDDTSDPASARHLLSTVPRRAGLVLMPWDPSLALLCEAAGRLGEQCLPMEHSVNQYPPD